MKKNIKQTFLSALVMTGLVFSTAAHSTNLIEVFQQSMVSDPIYQQAVAQRMATDEVVPINRAALLPNLSFGASPSISKTHITGSLAHNVYPPAYTTRSRVLDMSVTQTLFNYAQFAALKGAHATAKQANATFLAAQQNLILRVAAAYFAVLQDEDTLAYSRANKNAYAKQLDQVNQQFKVGVKTITDVYTAQASFDSSSATQIAAETKLKDDQENLRAITGVFYPHLATLSEKFPLISPQPADREAWVTTAQRQNWSVIAAEHGVEVALQNIKQQNAGHYPTINAQGSYSDTYTLDLQGSPIIPQGPSKTREALLTLNLNLPIYEGGLVVAETRQARYNYQVAMQQLEQSVRGTMNNARQSYMGIIAGIQQIKADQLAIKSSISSLNGLREGYNVGTQTLVDVVNQQKNVFIAQQQYAADRYAYVNNLLILKNAAGTLSPDDLCAINAWLIESRDNDPN